MTKQNFIESIAVCLLAVCALMIPACGGSGSGDDSSATTATKYNGPGSKWDFTLNNDGTFTVSKREDSSSPILFTVTGDWVTSSSGFRVLTVTGVTGTGGPSVGETAWAIDVPGYALLLNPMEAGSDQVIPMVVSGECPDEDLTANWVIVKKADSSDATSSSRDFFGSYTYTAASETATLPARYALDNAFTDQGSESLGASTCDEGLASVSDALMYLTSNGGAIVQTQLSDPDESSFIFALQQKAISNVNNYDGSYAGMVFDGNYSSGDRVIPASMTCSAATCNGSLLAGPLAGAATSDPWTLSLNGTIDSLAPGFVTGTLTDDGSSNSGNVACMIDIDVLGSGKKIISCVGQSPGDNTQMVNAIFTSI